MAAKLSHEQFLTVAIEKLRTEKSKGVHAVYSGLNAAWREYFQTEPKTDIQALVKAGKFHSHPCKGGVMVYKASEAPPAGLKALKTILG